tara:strand:+ start:1582 stop:1857 length:276 start_codon:yes stop_codon:yes gene_type:complete
MAEKTTTDIPAPPTPDQIEDSISLNVQDLQATVQALDVAVQRGAFKGAEMSQVGQVYDRISAFVDQVRKQQEATKAAQEQSGVEGEVKDGN